MKMKIFCLLLLVIAGAMHHAAAQANIYGPACVNIVTVYQYKITGCQNASTVQVCVTGGEIHDSIGQTIACKSFTGKQLITLFVQWTTNGAASLTVTPAGTNAVSIQVAIAGILNPGAISTNSRIQSVNRDTLPSMITCSAASGGTCVPSYSYQWQQSTNQVSWTDINGANSQHLPFNNVLSQSTFCRRKVTENESGTIAYSDVASIQVIIRDGETAQLFRPKRKNKHFVVTYKGAYKRHLIIAQIRNQQALNRKV